MRECLSIFIFIIMVRSHVGEKYNFEGLTTIDNCNYCKILTKSFNHGLRKTSRSKFDGGDAAWEESKLKSYANSEIRLVEIQEGLCSEVNKNQDHCYTLAEEVEALLEDWWFNHSNHASDLFTWLCIDTLKHCCPKSSFGPNCDTCPRSVDNIVCSGRGTCDGDGTRQGQGSCLCTKGFDGKVCEECAKNYYSDNPDSCKPCHKACDGCTGSGNNNCKSCYKGWMLSDNSCLDINECFENDACKDNQYCVNREGSYVCKKCDNSCKSCVGAGSSNCTLCESNLLLWGGNCIDEKVKDNLLQNAFRRICLYAGLLVILIFVFYTSKLIAAFTVLMIAVYVYFAETTVKFSTIEILSNHFKSN